MVMPKIEREAVALNYGKFVISPLESGYGITIGSALRRILLSSLEGAAVTSIRISDVAHEFSDIPGVREDVLQVMLNIKQLRMILHEGDSARLRLEVQGEGSVTAADIIAPAEVEIINPELYSLHRRRRQGPARDRDERRARAGLLAFRRARPAAHR
jgi:DNA-directed RNA polymerase subunit alpha